MIFLPTISATLFSLFFIFYFYIGYTAFISFHIIFIKPSPNEDWTASAIIFGAVLSIFGALSLLKWVLGLVYKKYGTSEIAQCKVDLLIGFGGIFISSMVPRFLIFYVEWNQHKIAPILLISFAVYIMMVLMFFINQRKIIQHLDYSNVIPHTIIASIAHFIIMVITVRCSFADKSEEQIHLLFPFQLVISFPCAASTIDILTILMGGVKETCQSRRDLIEESENKQAISKETSEPSCTDACLYFYSFLTSLIGTSAIFYIVFQPWTPEAFLSIKLITGSVLIVFGVLGLLKLIIFHCHKWFNPSKLRQCNINLAVGFGGCLLTSLFSRVAVYHVGLDVPILCSVLFVPIFIACLIYYLFIFGFRKTHNLNYASNIKPIIIIILINFFGLLASFRQSTFYENSVEREIIMVSQAVFFFLTTLSSMDLIVVLMGGVYTKKVEEDVKLVTVVKTEEVRNVRKVSKQIPKIHCPDCNMAYSETKIPRILKYCGHTVCERCANNKLKQTSGQYLGCPTCQTVTPVKGTAEKLLKNYSVLEIIHDFIDKN